MAQTLVFSSNPRKFNTLSMRGGMKKLVKNCKNIFSKYEVQQNTTLASQDEICPRTEEEHQNWLNEQMETQLILMF